MKIKRKAMFNDPNAANAPAANRSESPGRNGVKTRPVSKNMITKRITYVKTPYVAIIWPK